MSDKNVEIVPGQGLGQLKFGMSREQVKAILGDPDEIEIFNFEEDPDMLNESWHYDELDLSMSFDQEEEWKLINIAVSGDQYLFDKKAIIGIEKKELESLLKQMGYSDLEYEDVSTEETPNHALISSEAIGVNFWMDGDSLSEIQWSPLFEDEETMVWPSLS